MSAAEEKKPAAASLPASETEGHAMAATEPLLVEEESFLDELALAIAAIARHITS
jgi:hypothetical protein